jgi:8-oxo-dGTP pyrophosphatase MutT (NUDIX family)
MRGVRRLRSKGPLVSLPRGGERGLLQVESFAMSNLNRNMASIVTLEDVRRGLLRPAPPPEEHDLHMISLREGTKVTEAAVLVPLVNRPQGVQLLLTQRTEHLRDHGGQISFPGGRVEPDDPDRESTALRETEEEIGLARERIALLGRLPGYEIPSGFRIVPVVGWVEPPFDLKPDDFEVADIFEAPLAHFLDPANYQRREYHFRGRHRHYLAIPYEGRYIWGATAGMLYSLCRLMTGK